MLSRKVVKKDSIDVIPGSGVNTKQHCYEPYPESEHRIIFTAIGRIMKDKGTDELLEAARRAKKAYPNTIFRLIGDFDEGYEEKVFRLQEEGLSNIWDSRKTYILLLPQAMPLSMHPTMKG